MKQFFNSITVLFIIFFLFIPSGFGKEESDNGKKRISDFLPVTGGKLYYETAGEGENIIFIHDGNLHSMTWENQFEYFSRHYHVIRYDRRGYGQSSQPEAPYSDLDDLYQLFTQLNIEKAIVMGLSAGGRLTIDFALAYPEKITSLVLVGTIVRGFGYTSHFFSRGGHITSDDRSTPEKFLNYLFKKDPYTIYEKNAEARKKAYQIMANNLQNYDNEKKHRFRQNPKEKALPNLYKIKSPTLVVVGEFDLPDVHAHAGAIESGIPNARRIVVKNAGHLVPFEQPDAFNKAVEQFLIEEPFFMKIENEGIESAVIYFQKQQERAPNSFFFNEDRMIRLGYQYLQSNKVEDAIKIFKLNVSAYPNFWNGYDSLAEAYMKNEQTDLAIQKYEKSLDLNPDNTNAVEMLKRLKKQ